MIKRISVQNYTLIDKLEIEFPEGLTIITGETGAGKSILLGALSLILGNRADSQQLMDKSKKCIVEGSFILDEKKHRNFFTGNELDFEKETIIRREITSEGKSRAFINDTPVTLSLLKELSGKLIDVHSQHETLDLASSTFQLAALDAYAGCLGLVEEYVECFALFRRRQEHLSAILKQEQQGRKELDFIRFQFEELQDAGIKEGEEVRLEEELKMLSHSEEIKANLSRAIEMLSGPDVNLVSSLNTVRSVVSSLSRYKGSLTALAGRIDSVYIELKDIASELELAEQKVTHDPQHMEELSARLDTINRLLNKHGVKKSDELLEIKDSLEKKLSFFSSMEEEIKKAESEIRAMQEDVLKRAAALTERRKKAAPALEKEIHVLLRSLAMPDARFSVRFELLDVPGISGSDRIGFFFSANKGGEPGEISRIASGGELSRLMLSLKSVLAHRKKLPTLIFDEIDTGISGEVAAKVGAIMEEISSVMQVVAITHLPQIASRGGSHLYVYKSVEDNQTFSRIKKLGREERVEEIARMLSAGTLTQASRKNALELLTAGVRQKELSGSGK